MKKFDLHIHSTFSKHHIWGIDGIHGATESSLEGGKHISAGHVQIGDAYMQKKVQEFIIEARDKGLFSAVQDFGAGGVSSAFGELAEFTNGLELDISKHPVKYQGLLPWQMIVSESQERMGIVTKEKDLKAINKLAAKHDVELTVLGKFNNNGKFNVSYNGTTCAYLDLDFMHSGGPQFVLEAEWTTPAERGLKEPKLPFLR
jgi:phosphoribosylformylglycinamidine synthase